MSRNGKKAVNARRSRNDAVKSEPVEQKVEVRPPRPAECHRMIRDRLAGSLDLIVSGFIAQAKKGGAQHMKATVELLEPKKKAKRARRGESSAHRLLEDAKGWERSWNGQA